MSTTFPLKFGPADIPASVATLLEVLLPRLIEGEHPALVALREQLRHARVVSGEMTGVGFFVDFATPADVPWADPCDFTGGSAEIVVTGVEHGAGCVLFVRDGRLLMFEGFTYDDTWAIDAQVVQIASAVPISPDRRLFNLPVSSESNDDS